MEIKKTPLVFAGYRECEKAYNLVHSPEMNTAAVLDTETTGKTKTAVITQVSAFKLKKDRDMRYKRTDTLNLYVRPYLRIDPEAALLTGISNEMLEKYDFCEVGFAKIEEFLRGIENWIFIGYNPKFDIQKLDDLYRYCKGTESGVRNENTIDVMQMAEELIDRDALIGYDPNDPGRGHYSQVAVANYLGLDTKNAHDASADIQMTYRIMFILLRKYMEIRGTKKNGWQPLKILSSEKIGTTRQTSGYLFKVVSETEGTDKSTDITYNTYTGRFTDRMGILRGDFDRDSFVEAAFRIMSNQ